MAGTIIAPASNTAGSSASATTITRTATYTAGDRIIVFLHYPSTSITATVADTLGSTFNQIGTYGLDSANNRYAMFEAINVSGGATTITATFSSTVANRVIAFYRGTGLDSNAAQAGIAFNDQTSATAGTDTIVSASFTPTLPATCIALTVTRVNASTITAGTGFTSLGAISGYDALASDTSLAEWRNLAAGGSQTAKFSMSGGGDRTGTVVAVFGDAGAAAATSLVVPRRMARMSSYFR
jgi:hypothetical protein